VSPRPRVVVTIHGIRTHGRWQKEITPYLARHRLVPYHIDYGWFHVVRFFLPWSRKKQIRKVRVELRSLLEKAGTPRVSIVAHSFGTLIAMECLQADNGDLLYDRVVLTGSIVPRDFDWKAVLEKKWVMAVRNERASADWVVRMALLASRRPLRWLTRLKAGDSGRESFAQKHPALLDDWIAGDHSEAHSPLRFERWARFIAYPELPEDLLRKVVTEQQALRQEAAKVLDVDPELVRVNLFAPLDGALRIVRGATDNMKHAPEFEMQIEENHGATGTAFAQGKSCVVVKKGKTWTGNTLPGSELEKLNPRVRWAVSLPVKSRARGVVVGVVNVDGLDNIPALLQDPSSDDCKVAVLALHAGMLQRFEPCLEAAFRGDRPQRIEV
jgi:pimeloyl-ACP methyl ester carboxylesterase